MAILEDLMKAPDQNLADAAKRRLLKAEMIGKTVDIPIHCYGRIDRRHSGAARQGRAGRLLGVVVPGLHSGDANSSQGLPKI